MKFVQDFLRWIVIGAVFLLPIVPFIVANTYFFPYITGKNFTFRILVEIMAAAWLALALCVPQYRPRRSWVLAAFAVFVLIIGIADAFGAYSFKSMWSNYERMEGWVTLAHLALYLVAAVSVLNTENLWRRLFQVSLVASVLLSLSGFMQVVGVIGLGQGGAASFSARIDATFGNPIYLAAYMLFHVFIAAMLWAQMRKTRPEREHFWPGLFYCVVIGIDTLALFMTGTRGAMLGLIGGAFLTFILLSFGPGAKKWRTITVSFLVILVAIGGVVSIARDTAVVQNIVFLNRLSSISTGEATVKARFFNMGIAWQGVKERPILGWGQENYALVFDKYYDPRMYAQEQWFDRVHNSIFDWWIAGGTLGLLAFFSLFASALWVLWKGILGKGNAFSHEERSILTGLLAGYFVHNLTVFDNITSSILFVTILGYIAYREIQSTNTAPIVKREFLPEWALAVAAPVAGALAIFFIWSINANAMKANKLIIAAMQQQSAGLEQNLKFFQDSISYGTLGMQEAREQLAQVAVQVVTSDTVPADLKQKFVTAAVDELDKQSAASPLDARFPLFAGGLLDAAGLHNEATSYLQKAHELSPGKQTILYQLAQNALFRNDPDAALKYSKTAWQLYPQNLMAHRYYAALLIRLGKDAEADQVLAPIIPTGAAADPQIESAYASRKAYAKLIPIWEGRIAASPSDKDAYPKLAAFYYLTGDRGSAIETLQKLAVVHPELKAEVDHFIQQIRNGTLKVE